MERREEDKIIFCNIDESETFRLGPLIEWHSIEMLV